MNDDELVLVVGGDEIEMPGEWNSTLCLSLSDLPSLLYVRACVVV
jgi:hypothetical protein